MKLEDFNKKYKYTSDISLYGRVEYWTVMDEVDGLYRGDCEDYILTLKERVEDFDDLELYFCRIDEVGHCIGKLDGKWIDCNFKELRDNLPSNYNSVRKLNIFQIFIKKSLAWFDRTFRF